MARLSYDGAALYWSSRTPITRRIRGFGNLPPPQNLSDTVYPILRSREGRLFRS